MNDFEIETLPFSLRRLRISDPFVIENEGIRRLFMFFPHRNLTFPIFIPQRQFKGLKHFAVLKLIEEMIEKEKEKIDLHVFGEFAYFKSSPNTPKYLGDLIHLALYAEAHLKTKDAEAYRKTPHKTEVRKKLTSTFEDDKSFLESYLETLEHYRKEMGLD